MSLAEETEAGSSEYRERLLDLAESSGGEIARAFAAAYVRRLSTEGISPEHLAAEVLGAFAFADERGRTPVAVRAFNPTLADDGYEPLGSVLETNTDDWPFLVDSVSAALEARGEQVARLVHPIIGISREDGRDHRRQPRPQRGAPRVGHALRPRAQAHRARARGADGRHRARCCSPSAARSPTSAR